MAALIVEDGSIVPGADSYISVAAANSYHASMGNTAWDALDDTDQKAPFLRRATQYIEGQYREAWAGFRVQTGQALSWPRYYVPIKDAGGVYGNFAAYYSPTAIPTQLQTACAELALKISQGIELAPDQDRVTLREKVGPIDIEYAQGELPYAQFRAIDMLLQPFMSSIGISAKVVRT